MNARDEAFPGVPDHAGLDGYEPSFVDVDGTNTRYYDVGEGDPLVLVHGGTWEGSASANTWTRTFEYLAEDHRVLAFDRVGCGLTDNPAEDDDFVYETDLAHALGFLDAMDLESCHLGGFSRGGGLATRMAVEDPDRVETLIVNNSATLGPPVADNGYRRSRLFRMDELGYDPGDPEYIRDYYEQYSYRTDYVTERRCRTAAFMHSHPKFERAREVLEAQPPGETWSDTLKAHMRHARREIEAGALELPVLYLYGINDMTVPLEMATGAFNAIANHSSAARLKMINECGHMSFLEHPAEFAHSVADYVARHGGE